MRKLIVLQGQLIGLSLISKISGDQLIDLRDVGSSYGSAYNIILLVLIYPSHIIADLAQNQGIYAIVEKRKTKTL